MKMKKNTELKQEEKKEGNVGRQQANRERI
jgi:hypothetical protein